MTDITLRRLPVLAFLLLFLQAAPALASAAESASPSQAPNILFILTDNQAASLIGAYGNSEINTPNIDRLAQQGTLFTQAFAVNGMCSPTRATLMTGLLPSQHGVHNWLDDEMMSEWPRDWSAVAEFRTLPYTLKEHGYDTAMIGKWHLGQPWQASLGYDHWVTFTDGHTLDFWNNTVIQNGEVSDVVGRHIVDFFTDKAVEYIEQHDGSKPFYLQLNYDGPYVNPPTNMGPARNRFFAQYQGMEFKSFPREAVHANLLDQLLSLLRSGRESSFLSQIIQMVLRMNADQDTMANIASQNTLVDDGVGKVLAALKQRGLDNNTVVVFSSDQGNFYGQHGLWTHTIITQPSNLYETAMRVPLIFRQPGRIQANHRSDALIPQYDIAATLLELGGLAHVPLQNSPGQSFAALLQGQTSEGRQAIYYEQEETRGIRTARYAYWGRLEATGSPELYDIVKDPQQAHNLYGQAKYKPLVKQLDGQLRDFFERYARPEYNLWAGGVAKGSVQRPEVFKALYGQGWEPVAEVVPAFSGD